MELGQDCRVSFGQADQIIKVEPGTKRKQVFPFRVDLSSLVTDTLAFEKYIHYVKATGPVHHDPSELIAEDYHSNLLLPSLGHGKILRVARDEGAPWGRQIT